MTETTIQVYLATVTFFANIEQQYSVRE